MRISGDLVTLLLLLPCAAAAQTVSGHVYVTLGDGSSQLLRGTEVFLICRTQEVDSTLAASVDAMSRVATAGLDAVETAASRGSDPVSRFVRRAGATYFASRYLPRLPEAYYSQLGTGRISTARTNVDGRYVIGDVTAGRYYVVARYRTAFNDGIWVVPVDVSDSPFELDLGNFNLTDLRQTLRIADVDEAMRWVEQMIATYFASPDERLAFVEGQRGVLEQASALALPRELLVPLECQHRH